LLGKREKNKSKQNKNRKRAGRKKINDIKAILISPALQ